MGLTSHRPLYFFQKDIIGSNDVNMDIVEVSA